MRQSRLAAILSFSIIFSIATTLASCGQSNVVSSPTGLSPAQSGGVNDPGVRMTSSSNFRIEHLVTWTTLGVGNYEPKGENWSMVAPFVDWGITKQGPAAAKLTDDLNQAGIISIYYTDPNRQKVNGPEYTNDESTFAHDCSGNRILITKLPYKFYLMNPASVDLYQLWIAELETVKTKWHGNPAYVFEDTADHINYVSSMPCKFWQPSWDASTNAMDVTFQNAVKTPIIYNAGDIHLLNGTVGVSPAVTIDSTTAGGLTEACFGNGFALSRPLQTGENWRATQEQLLRMQHDRKVTVCHANSLNDGAANLDQRMYVYASFLITYDPKYSIFSELYATPSKLSVFPEVFLVPHFAYQPVIHDISEMAQKGGTYARQYKNCDFYGVPVGECAFVVNPSLAKPAPFPFPGKYSATMVLSGYGVLDNGQVSITGPPPGTTIPPHHAVVAIGLVSPSPSPSP